MNKGGFSWKRLSGFSAAKSRVSRATGVPFTKSGRQRKVGRIVTGGGCALPVLLVVLFVAVLLVFVAAGCGSSGGSTSTTPTTVPTTATTPADTTPPTTTASDAGGWHSGTVRIALDAIDSESTVAKTEYRIDGKAWKTGTTVKVKGQGTHRIAFRSTDSEGNVEAASVSRVRIDNRPPTTHALNAVSVKKGNWITVRYKIADLTPRAKVKIHISGSTSKTFNRGSQPTNKVLRLRFKLPPGQYTYTVAATDLVGNRAVARGSNSITVKKPPAPSGPLVEVTETGSKYHLPSCYYTNETTSGHRYMTVAQAKALGYTPCSVCNPPG
jgi:hypothetical protein